MQIYGRPHNIKKGVCDVCNGHCELLSDNLHELNEQEIYEELRDLAVRQLEAS